MQGGRADRSRVNGGSASQDVILSTVAVQPTGESSRKPLALALERARPPRFPAAEACYLSLEALGSHDPVHVMGHDWGAAVAWCLAISRPELVRSAVAISVGHPTEYARAGLEQKRKGLYTIGWQFPVLAERWLVANDWARMRHWLRQHPDPESCLRNLARTGRLTAGLNWYRANLRSMLLGSWPQCTVPMLGIWGSEDHCLAEDQMQRSGCRVSGPWHYERIEGAGHWLPLEEPQRITNLAIDWFNRH